MKWNLLCLAGSGVLVHQLWKKIGWQYAIFMAYCFTSSLMVCLFKVGPYHYARNSILYEPSKAWIYLICLNLILIMVNTRKIVKCIQILFIINLGFTAACLALDNWEQGKIVGFDLNISVNATLLSLMLPFFFRWWTALLTLAVIFWGGTTMGLFSVLAVISSYYFSKTNKKLLSSITAIGVMGGVLTLAYYFGYGEQLWNFSGRLPVWQALIEFVSSQNKVWTGFGVGTFSHILPALKIVKPEITNQSVLYIWAHSDVLQWYFEAGVIGCIIILPFLISTGYKALNRPALFSFFVGFLVSCCGNFPSHLASSSLLCILMISLLNQGDFDEEL